MTIRILFAVLVCLLVASPVAMAENKALVLPRGSMGVQWARDAAAVIVRGNGSATPDLVSEARADDWHVRSDKERDANRPCRQGYITAWLRAGDGWYRGSACVRASLVR